MLADPIERMIVYDIRALPLDLRGASMTVDGVTVQSDSAETAEDKDASHIPIIPEEVNVRQLSCMLHRHGPRDMLRFRVGDDRHLHTILQLRAHDDAPVLDDITTAASKGEFPKFPGRARACADAMIAMYERYDASELRLAQVEW